MKDRVLALLSHHGDFDPEEGGVSALGSLAKRLKDERDAAENARLEAAATEAARLEARSRENVRQEGALGALPRAYGVDAPRVSGAAEAHQRQNQDACDLLAQNPTSQNNHTRPVGMPVLPPTAATPIVTPPTADVTTNGDRAASTQQQQAAPPQLPTLLNLAAMAVPPSASAGGGTGTGHLPAVPGLAGPANNRGRAVAIQQQRFAANAATAGVGAPIVVNETDAAGMRRNRRVDNMDAIDGINRAMLEATKLIASTIGRARTTAPDPPIATAAAASSPTGDLGTQIDSLYKRLKKAKEENHRDSVSRYERLIKALEEKEEEEIEACLCK